MEDGQILANWGQHLADGIKIVVDVKDFNPNNDARLLIPFIQNNKIGLLNKSGEIVLEPKYEAIIDDCFYENDIVRVKMFGSYRNCNGIIKATPKYRAINTKGEFVTNADYDGICVSTDKKILTVKDYKKGHAVFDITGENIVPFGKYNYIDGFDSGLARVKNNKWGIINAAGQIVLPLECDRIWNFYDKNRESTNVVLNGVEKQVYFRDLKPSLPKHLPWECEENNDYGTRYGEYAGTYAQDVMGYSDDVIDDAFDGEPDAYWNID